MPELMAKKQRVASTPATVALSRAGISFEVHAYEHDPQAESYGEEAARALGLDPARVFKTLFVSLDRRLCVGIVPVTSRLDLKAVAAALGGKAAAMADPADAERASGYVVGGISPIGQRRQHPTVLDDSAPGFSTVFVSGGRRGLEVELRPGDLVAMTSAVTAPIRR